ncbi:MAG: hypothetical protein QG581_294, partial [Patescibacteria group bacterium]|nr:hypothetical protein [Patescibacteria group bacterium]
IEQKKLRFKELHHHEIDISGRMH